MATATCLSCGADVAVVRSIDSGVVSVVDGMPTPAGVAAVDFRSGTYRLHHPGFGPRHLFHKCGYERIVQVRPGVWK